MGRRWYWKDSDYTLDTLTGVSACMNSNMHLSVLMHITYIIERSRLIRKRSLGSDGNVNDIYFRGSSKILYNCILKAILVARCKDVLVDKKIPFLNKFHP